jgi:hypothetical protein
MDYTKDLSPKAEDLFLLLRFTNYYLLRLIGFDRSAFVARPRGAGRH